ncbi:uncharacterized protein LOC130564859 [Triplophysa rosa]|uniref:Uncharacterized protein n=1 Tax=Triplophysa rosa TaxID=992332 RepID=A0A9W7WI70_TRIRA|nr:uncharacterized protein LOC130564859 [Triplophysa rosa]KAI7800476.1 hypothetical protein IRJ41_004140 [Triplophysa rosa]
MKFIVCLSGLLLIFLLPHWTQSLENEAVDKETLAKIINFFEQNYKRVDADGQPRQYATAINVPKAQCQASFNPSQKNFLTQEEAQNVKNVIGDESTALYQGKQLIAAGNREKIIKKNKKILIHSESLLLNPPDNSPMTKLLNKNKQDCSIFYTFNSPCVDTCLKEQGPYSILKALDSWSKHSGIKAFVFKEFWKFDKEKDLKSKFKLVASRVPLYRCVSETECHACKGEGNTPIDENCLPPKTNRP